jgi:hypothetical protein
MRDVRVRKRLKPQKNLLDHMAARNWQPIFSVPRRPFLPMTGFDSGEKIAFYRSAKEDITGPGETLYVVLGKE